MQQLKALSSVKFYEHKKLPYLLIWAFPQQNFTSDIHDTQCTHGRMFVLVGDFFFEHNGSAQSIGKLQLFLEGKNEEEKIPKQVTSLSYQYPNGIS